MKSTYLDTSEAHLYYEVVGHGTPVLILAGTRDLIKTSHTRWMAAQIPNSQLRLIEGGTHKVLFLREQQCMSYILDFLRQNHL